VSPPPLYPFKLTNTTLVQATIDYEIIQHAKKNGINKIAGYRRKLRNFATPVGKVAVFSQKKKDTDEVLPLHLPPPQKHKDALFTRACKFGI
jgi:hypothetical protein